MKLRKKLENKQKVKNNVNEDIDLASSWYYYQQKKTTI